MKKNILISPIILFFLILIIFFYLLIIDRNPSELPSVLINKKVPTFEAKLLLENNTFISSGEFGNETTLVNFFATWCKPCRDEHPYLSFAAMLMAGIDGIKNKIDPGKPLDKDLYALSESEVKKIPTVCGSLREAMENLDRDRKFLTQGEVFTDDQIDAYIALKFEEIYKLEHTPHPIEFDMYYSC